MNVLRGNRKEENIREKKLKLPHDHNLAVMGRTRPPHGEEKGDPEKTRRKAISYFIPFRGPAPSRPAPRRFASSRDVKWHGRPPQFDLQLFIANFPSPPRLPASYLSLAHSLSSPRRLPCSFSSRTQTHTKKEEILIFSFLVFLCVLLRFLSSGFHSLVSHILS